MNEQLVNDAHDRDAELASSDLYSAEFIVDKKRGTYRGNKVNLYRVRWTGYTAADDTWEPIENLNDTLLSEFEESLKRRRPRQQSNAPAPEEDTPLVTWNDLLQILGSCPPEQLPHCLQPTPLPHSPKISRNYSDKDNKQLLMSSFYSSSDFSQNSVSNNGSKHRSAAAESVAFPEVKCHLVAPKGHAPVTPLSNKSICCARRPRGKQVAPSRSRFANVLMNY